MAEYFTFQDLRERRKTAKENMDLRGAVSILERKASLSLQRLQLASNGLEPLKAFKIWEAVANALELAEMAIEGGGDA